MGAIPDIFIILVGIGLAVALPWLLFLAADRNNRREASNVWQNSLDTIRKTMVLTVAATLTCALFLIPISAEAKTVMLGPSTIPGFGFNFIVDGLGVYVAIMSALIGLMIVMYSVGYMREYQHLGEYYFLVVLFLGAMMGLVLSANLLLIYIFWEITAICSSFDRLLPRPIPFTKRGHRPADDRLRFVLHAGRHGNGLA